MLECHKNMSNIEGEPKSEEAYKAEADEIEKLTQFYAGMEKDYYIEKDIRQGEKILDDMRKNNLPDPEEIIPYWEKRIELAKAEIEKRKAEK